jgi:hypothetical protein
MEIGAKEFSDEIADVQGDEDGIGRGGMKETDMSSKGEMKTSLRLMIWCKVRARLVKGKRARRFRVECA